ncbi:hypothetical protein FS837_005623, partial [Tulasnella sp. UAMH 9824]
MSNDVKDALAALPMSGIPLIAHGAQSSQKTGAPIGEPLCGHDFSVHAVGFSEDGTFLASGSFDNTIRLWNVNTGACIGDPLVGNGHRVESFTVWNVYRLLQQQSLDSDTSFYISPTDNRTTM